MASAAGCINPRRGRFSRDVEGAVPYGICEIGERDDGGRREQATALQSRIDACITVGAVIGRPHQPRGPSPWLIIYMIQYFGHLETVKKGTDREEMEYIFGSLV